MKTYNNANDFSNEEILKIMNAALDFADEGKAAAKRAKKQNDIRKGKADFCNLKAMETIFMEGVEIF